MRIAGHIEHRHLERTLRLRVFSEPRPSEGRLKDDRNAVARWAVAAALRLPGSIIVSPRQYYYLLAALVRSVASSTDWVVRSRGSRRCVSGGSVCGRHRRLNDDDAATCCCSLPRW